MCDDTDKGMRNAYATDKCEMSQRDFNNRQNISKHFMSQ